MCEYNTSCFMLTKLTKGVDNVSLNEKAKELADMVVKTNEFNELKQSKNNVDKNKELKSKLEDFNKRHSSLLNSKISSKEAEAKIAELNKSFENLSKLPEMSRLLKAEKSFNEIMMSRVYKTVNDAIEAGLKS